MARLDNNESNETNNAGIEEMITVNGQKYEVLESRQIEVKGDKRTIFILRKPKGKRSYEAVLYSNNQWSSVIPA